MNTKLLILLLLFSASISCTSTQKEVVLGSISGSGTELNLRAMKNDDGGFCVFIQALSDEAIERRVLMLPEIKAKFYLDEYNIEDFRQGLMKAKEIFTEVIDSCFNGEFPEDETQVELGIRMPPIVAYWTLGKDDGIFQISEPTGVFVDFNYPENEEGYVSVSGLFEGVRSLFQTIYLPIYNEMEFDTLIRILDEKYIKSKLGIK